MMEKYFQKKMSWIKKWKRLHRI